MTNSRAPDTAKGNLDKLHTPFGYAADAENTPSAEEPAAPTKSLYESVLERSAFEMEQMERYCASQGVAGPKSYKP